MCNSPGVMEHDGAVSAIRQHGISILASHIIYTFKEVNSALNDKMILNLSKVIIPLH